MSFVSKVRNLHSCKYWIANYNSATIRLISTSKKNRDTITVDTTKASTTTSDVGENKNWMSYGFSETDKEEDRNAMNSITFFGVTVVFVFGGFCLAYRPDDLGRDWAQREGFLELRRREKLGLPLVDPNYIPADQIVLPSDEELGDEDIII